MPWSSLKLQCLVLIRKPLTKLVWLSGLLVQEGNVFKWWIQQQPSGDYILHSYRSLYKQQALYMKRNIQVIERGKVILPSKHRNIRYLVAFFLAYSSYLSAGKERNDSSKRSPNYWKRKRIKQQMHAWELLRLLWILCTGWEWIWVLETRKNVSLSQPVSWPSRKIWGWSALGASFRVSTLSMQRITCDILQNSHEIFLGLASLSVWQIFYEVSRLLVVSDLLMFVVMYMNLPDGRKLGCGW